MNKIPLIGDLCSRCEVWGALWGIVVGFICYIAATAIQISMAEAAPQKQRARFARLSIATCWGSSDFRRWLVEWWRSLTRTVVVNPEEYT
jgi:hypothetical protein